MALASKMPTQIGSTRCPSLSRRMMIGMFVIGSTISPLIVISICIDPRLARAPSPESGAHRGSVKHGFPAQAVRIRAGDRHRHDPPDPRRIARQVHHRVAGRAARQLPCRAAGSSQSTSTPRRRPTAAVEQLPLDPLLQRLQRDDPPRLLRPRSHRPAAASAPACSAAAST